MRNFVAFASVVAVSVAASVAHADPSLTAAAATTAAPTTYVQLGGEVGGNDGNLTAGGTAEVGKRVSQNVWLHGSVTEAAAGQLFATGNGSMLQVRGGADVLSCDSTGSLCAYGGADLGFQHTQFVGESTPLFCTDDTGEGCMGDAIDQHHDTLIGVARAGFDVGGKHLRYRPGVELAVGNDGVNGFNLTQSIAYRF